MSINNNFDFNEPLLNSFMDKKIESEEIQQEKIRLINENNRLQKINKELNGIQNSYKAFSVGGYDKKREIDSLASQMQRNQLDIIANKKKLEELSNKTETFASVDNTTVESSEGAVINKEALKNVIQKRIDSNNSTKEFTYQHVADILGVPSSDLGKGDLRDNRIKKLIDQLNVESVKIAKDLALKSIKFHLGGGTQKKPRFTYEELNEEGENFLEQEKIFEEAISAGFSEIFNNKIGNIFDTKFVLFERGKEDTFSLSIDLGQYAYFKKPIERFKLSDFLISLKKSHPEKIQKTLQKIRLSINPIIEEALNRYEDNIFSRYDLDIKEDGKLDIVFYYAEGFNQTTFSFDKFTNLEQAIADLKKNQKKYFDDPLTQKLFIAQIEGSRKKIKNHHDYAFSKKYRDIFEKEAPRLYEKIMELLGVEQEVFERGEIEQEVKKVEKRINASYKANVALSIINRLKNREVPTGDDGKKRIRISHKNAAAILGIRDTRLIKKGSGNNRGFIEMLAGELSTDQNFKDQDILFNTKEDKESGVYIEMVINGNRRESFESNQKRLERLLANGFSNEAIKKNILNGVYDSLLHGIPLRTAVMGIFFAEYGNHDDAEFLKRILTDNNEESSMLRNILINKFKKNIDSSASGIVSDNAGQNQRKFEIEAVSIEGVGDSAEFVVYLEGGDLAEGIDTSETNPDDLIPREAQNTYEQDIQVLEQEFVDLEEKFKGFYKENITKKHKGFRNATSTFFKLLSNTRTKEFDALDKDFIGNDAYGYWGLLLDKQEEIERLKIEESLSHLDKNDSVYATEFENKFARVNKKILYKMRKKLESYYVEQYPNNVLEKIRDKYTKLRNEDSAVGVLWQTQEKAIIVTLMVTLAGASGIGAVGAAGYLAVRGAQTAFGGEVGNNTIKRLAALIGSVGGSSLGAVLLGKEHLAMTLLSGAGATSLLSMLPPQIKTVAERGIENIENLTEGDINNLVGAFEKMDTEYRKDAYKVAGRKLGVMGAGLLVGGIVGSQFTGDFSELSKEAEGLENDAQKTKLGQLGSRIKGWMNSFGEGESNELPMKPQYESSRSNVDPNRRQVITVTNELYDIDNNPASEVDADGKIVNETPVKKIFATEKVPLETKYTIKKGESVSVAIEKLLQQDNTPDWFKNPNPEAFKEWQDTSETSKFFKDKPEIQKMLYLIDRLDTYRLKAELLKNPDTLKGLDSLTVQPGDKFGFTPDGELYWVEDSGDANKLTDTNGSSIKDVLKDRSFQETNLRDVSVSEARTIESKVPTPPPVNPNERLFGGEESTEEVIMQETNAAPVLVPISEVEEIVESEPAASNPDAAASAGFQNTANKFYGDGQGNVVASEFDKARTTIGTDNERGVPAEKVNRTRAGLNMFGADVINPQFAETQADTGSADYLRETREADNPGYDNIAPDGSKVTNITAPTAAQIEAERLAQLQGYRGIDRIFTRDDAGVPVNISNLSGELGDMVTPDTGDNTNTIPMINQVIPGATQGINTFTNNASEDIQNATDGDPTTSVESSLPNTQNQGPGFSLGLGGVAESLSQTGRNILESLTSGLIPGSGPAPEVDPDAFAQDNPTDTIV